MLFLSLFAGWGEPVVEPPPPPPAPAIVLITLDTTRADALGAYGRVPSVTPHLDELAARGLRVDEVQTTTPLTLPAHSSMMTGLDPDHHGVRDNNGFLLEPEHRTLAEQLQADGWTTGAFVGAVVLDGVFGLNQGFDTYDDGFDLTRAGSEPMTVAQWTGDVVSGRAQKWLRGQPRDARLFLWMHLYDPHQPLEAPEPYASTVPDPYLAEVAAADAAVGQLLAVFDELQRQPWVLVVADHGEGQGEHGEQTHGQFLYRSTTRVPLLLSGPGVTPDVMPGPVSVVDVAPTLLRLAQAPALPSIDGVDLLGPIDPDRVVYAETLYPRRQFGFSELRAVQTARYRTIQAPRPELYDWRADPGELTNLATDQTELVTSLQQDHLGVSRGDVGQTGVVDADLTQALAALGYLSGGGVVDSNVSWRDLPDPKDHPDISERFEAMVVAARTRPPAEGVEVIEAFLVQWPGVGGARHLLSLAHEKAGHPERARAALQPLLENQPDDVQLLVRTGQLLLMEGKLEDARTTLNLALERNPGHPSAYAGLAELERRQGNCAAAIEQVTKGLAKAPEQSSLLLVRGACRQQLGDLTGSRDDLLRVAELDPANEDVHFVLGTTLALLGDLPQATEHFGLQVQRTPTNPAAHGSYGAALFAVGRYAEAMAPLRIAADEVRLGAEPPILLADCIVRTDGDLDQALAWAALAQVRDPSDPRIGAVRSAIFMAKGDVDAAIKAIETP